MTGNGPERVRVRDNRCRAGRLRACDQRRTRTPVRAIVERWRAGVAPEEMPSNLPHLSMAQVFAALSYFSDHQEEIIAHIERNRVPPELIHPLAKHL